MTIITGALGPIPRFQDSELDRTPQDALDLVRLTPLMKRTSGVPEIVIGLIDGPILRDHPDLASARVREVDGGGRTCSAAGSAACMHGTFVAGILSARRSSAAPAICPNCTLLVRPIFAEPSSGHALVPSASADDLAEAIVQCIDAGVRLVNLSAALVEEPSSKSGCALAEALDYAARRGGVVVAAAGNQGTVGSTAITRHPSVIAVVACDRRGRALGTSNVGHSIGRRGLTAPGEGITSLGSDVPELPAGGTSVAAPFVTGAIALAWSEAPNATAAQIRVAVTRAHSPRRPTVVPALLNALAIHDALQHVGKHS